MPDTLKSDSKEIDGAENIIASETPAEETEPGINAGTDNAGEDDIEQIAAEMPVNGKARRIAAMLGVILLVVMILATFVVACLNFEGSGQVFMALLLCDIAIPVFLWFILHFLNAR